MNGGLFFSEIKKQKKFLNDNKSIIIDIDMNKYVEELSNNLNSRIMTTTNWKEVFQYCKQTLQINKTEVILNIFILLERLANKIDFTDFEIKTYYNNILPEILLYINSQNTHFKNLSRKVLSNLIKQDENIEFVVRFLLLEGLESNDFILKFNSVLALKLLFEQNYNFFCNKVNYTRKIISSLIYHSHDKSDRLSCLAIENLKEFIAGLPNYSEIAKGLSYDLLLEIDELKYKEKLNNKEKIDEVIQAAEKKKFTNQINEDFEIYKKQNQNTLHNSAMCINGFYFAVFPQIVVEGIDVNFSNEARIENFKKFKAIYEENNKRQDFTKFISSFFDFTVGFCEDKINLIAYSALIIIDSMISYIPGINLLVNMYSALPKIIRCLSHQQTMIRDQTKEILKKVMMLLPTSSIFSFFVNNLDNGNWFLVSEVLNMIHFMLSHLNEIFNDIDFSEKQFDVSSFIKILSLFRHPVPKVRITAKKIIKYVGENVIIQERFLDTLEQIISDELFSEVKKLFKFKTLPKETSNYLDYNEDKMNVASSQMIQKLKEEINLKEFNEENDNKSEKDFKVFKNIKVYKDINDLNKSNNIDKSNDKIIVDEENLSKANIEKRGNKYIENYQNYEGREGSPEVITISKPGSALKKIKKSISKAKHKKYNNPDDPGFNGKYDKKYDYSNKDKETLSPLKYPESVYSNIYAGIKSNLDWEKQFKSMDDFRKIMIYNKELLDKDTYYFSIIFDQILHITNTIRPHLAKNALLTLSEIFEIEGLNMEQKIEPVVKNLVKKIVEKNTFIGKEAKETLYNFIKFSNHEKIIEFLLKGYGKNHSTDYHQIIIDCVSKASVLHKENFIGTQVFHQAMVFIANEFTKDKKTRPQIKEFFLVLDKLFKGDQERMERLIRRYYSNESVNFLIRLVYN